MRRTLVSAGYRFVALALRGYAPSGIPTDGDYTIRRLAADVIALLDVLGVARTAVLGHDWGASAGFAMAALAPERLSALIALAIPPLTVFPEGWRERLARPHNLYLRLGPMSNWWLRRNDFAEVTKLYRTWSPNWDVPIDHLAQVVAALRAPERSRAAVDYYRARLSSDDRRMVVKPIATPTLMIYGSDEPEVRQDAFARAQDMTGPGSRAVRIDGVGHWPHLEAAAACEAGVLAALDRACADAH